jgi:3-hydroxybutyryl-CoA dehydrogenase
VRIEDVKVITVIGAGNMGHQIGTLCALHGFETYITDTNSAQLKKAQDFVASYLPGRVEKGRISQETADITSSLIHFEPNIELASQNADVIIEAVFEELELKRSIFTQLESICNSEVLFATNASRIPSSEIASVLNYPSRICNMHFFNPALVMKCVEVMRGDHTSDDAFELACALCEKLGKTPARLNKELNGMVGSRVAGAIFNECMTILHNPCRQRVLGRFFQQDLPCGHVSTDLRRERDYQVVRVLQPCDRYPQVFQLARFGRFPEAYSFPLPYRQDSLQDDTRALWLSAGPERRSHP